MLSSELHLALLDAENPDHWLSSCCCARCSSLAQLFVDWSRESPATAAASSLQLRAISNFGTVSATVMTNCELRIIIENEIGICSLLPVFGSSTSSTSARTHSS